MHFPLIPPHTDWNMGLTAICVAILGIVTIGSLIAGYMSSYGDDGTVEFKFAHASAAIALLTFVFGVWSIAAVFLFFFGKSVVRVWGNPFQNLQRSEDSDSSSNSSSRY